MRYFGGNRAILMFRSAVIRMKRSLGPLLMGRNGIFVLIIVLYTVPFGYLVFWYANLLPIDAVINISGLLLTVEGILLGLGVRQKTSVRAPSIALTAILYSLFVITLGEIGKNSKDSPIAQSGVATLLIFTILLFSGTVIAYAIEITRTEVFDRTVLSGKATLVAEPEGPSDSQRKRLEISQGSMLMARLNI